MKNCGCQKEEHSSCGKQCNTGCQGNSSFIILILYILLAIIIGGVFLY